MKSKILLIGQFFPPINGCTLANEVLKDNLILEGITFDVINTSTFSLDNKKLGKFSLAKVLEFVKCYKYIFKIYSCSLIYTTPGQTFLGIVKYAPFYLTALLFKKPYIIHIHGNYLGHQYSLLSGLKKRIFYFFVSNCNIGIVLSNTLLSNFEGLLPKQKIRIVENFAQNELLDSSLVKKNDKLRILYMSNLMKEKGILDFLDALIELKNQEVSFEALIAGKIESGIEEDIYRRLKILDNEVRYLGIITGKEKKQAFQRSNVFCLPTYYNQEGQPISILEGMATKNIILTTKHSGIPDICSEKNAFFCEKRNKNDIVEKLKIIDKNLVGLLEEMGNLNFSKVSEMYTEKMFSQKLIHIFNDLSETQRV